MGCVGGITNVGLSSCAGRDYYLQTSYRHSYIGHGTISDCDVGNLRQDSFKTNVLTHLKVQLDLHGTHHTRPTSSSTDSTCIHNTYQHVARRTLHHPAPLHLPPPPSGGGVRTDPRDAGGTDPDSPPPPHLPGFASREYPEIVNRGGRAATDRLVGGQPLDDPVDARPTGEPIPAELLGDTPLCRGSQWGLRPNTHRLV